MGESGFGLLGEVGEEVVVVVVAVVVVAVAVLVEDDVSLDSGLDDCQGKMGIGFISFFCCLIQLNSRNDLLNIFFWFSLLFFPYFDIALSSFFKSNFWS